MSPPSGGKITKIEPQKKNPRRFSIFIDDQFALGVDGGILLRFDLRQGVRLSGEQLELLEREESTRQARQVALKSLARTPKSTREISNKLKEKGFREPIIETIIGELEEYGYLNDRDFAKLVSENYLRTKPLGPKLLSQKLFKKGLARELIEQTVEQFYREHDEVTLARRLLSKRKRAYGGLDSRTARKKKADYLSRRGFSWDAIKEVLALEESE